jgi:hypothetical protein
MRILVCIIGSAVFVLCVVLFASVVMDSTPPSTPKPHICKVVVLHQDLGRNDDVDYYTVVQFPDGTRAAKAGVWGYENDQFMCYKPTGKSNLYLRWDGGHVRIPAWEHQP